MQSKAATVEAYLRELPSDRRAALQAVREVILENLGEGFEEGMQYGMISYHVPHSIYPAGYHCDPRQPVPFAGLASQKNHMSLYLMSIYSPAASKAFAAAWAKTGKKLDMGKACIRFQKLDDLALDVIAQAIRRQTAQEYIEQCEATMAAYRKQKATKRSGKKTAAKSAKPKTKKPKAAQATTRKAKSK